MSEQDTVTDLLKADMTLGLPFDMPHSLQSLFQPAESIFPFPSLLFGRFGQVCSEQHVSLPTGFLALFSLLLARYSRQSTFILGYQFAEKTLEEDTPLVNISPLLIRVERAFSFVSLLQHIDQAITTMICSLPMQPSIDISQLKVFFASPKIISDESRLLHRPSLTYDLLFAVDLSRLVPSGIISYNTTLFTKRTIQRMEGHYLQLLTCVIADPEQPICEYELLTTVERQQQVVEWNATAAPYPQDRCIHELFEEQVARTPQAVAVRFGEQELSYEQLNTRANQLAYMLQERGVGPETLVGLCVERSLEMVVGMLGILKAGGTYVPLDPDYPAERLAFLLTDTQIRLILCRQHLDDRVPLYSAQILCLDTQGLQGACDSIPNPSSETGPQHLAYVMYTSGSTGQPKGVAVPHESVARLVKNNWYARLDEEQVMVQLAPLAFDASTFEIWGSLLNGAQLVLAPPHQLSLEELGDLLQKQGITTLWLTAGLFHQMVEENVEGLRGIKQLLAGGDVLSLSHVQKVIQKYPECQVINGYGPTECTTFACCYPLERIERGQTTLPIGRPIANTEAYVLDPSGHFVPIGVVGELYIGGPGVARGYFHRPEITAENFVPHPFSTRPGERLYRTGDLVRYRADGVLDYVGRLDQQVKIRGFRIELGEVEAVLRQHPVVQDCAVLVRENTPGEKQVVAYVVWKEEQVVSGVEVRQYLSTKLPSYMLPAFVVPVSSLPLTPNGKLDRKALPAPELLAGGKIIPPQNVIEEVLVQIWSNVLHLRQVSTKASFFALGGDSLALTRVFSRIRKLFQVNIPLHVFFEQPTIVKIAQMLVENESYPDQVQRIAQIAKKVKTMSFEEKQNLLVNQSQKEKRRI